MRSVEWTQPPVVVKTAKAPSIRGQALIWHAPAGESLHLPVKGAETPCGFDTSPTLPAGSSGRRCPAIRGAAASMVRSLRIDLPHRLGSSRGD